LKLHGVRILTGHQMPSVEQGHVRAENRATREVVEIPGQAVLIAVGREPVIDRAMFDRMGIVYSAKGIGVDDHLRTNVPGLWAIGDATGKSVLAHVGMQQGVVCAENILAAPGAPLRRMDYDVIPAVVYTIPEVVAVGHVPAEADEVQSRRPSREPAGASRPTRRGSSRSGSRITRSSRPRPSVTTSRS
jgi:dihydrolipoamide dehydrogenase